MPNGMITSQGNMLAPSLAPAQALPVASLHYLIHSKHKLVIWDKD
jgi:hypothetical protein